MSVIEIFAIKISSEKNIAYKLKKIFLHKNTQILFIFLKIKIIKRIISKKLLQNNVITQKLLKAYLLFKVIF